MKTTLDIPDTIYRQFKTRAAMNGETMRNATLNFIIRYISDPATQTPQQSLAPTSELPSWLGCGAQFAHANMSGPHDMESVRASIARKRFQESVSE